MDIQTKESRKKILIAVRKTEDMVLHNEKMKGIDAHMATIRENALRICDDGQDSAKRVIRGYERGAYQALFELERQIGCWKEKPFGNGNAGLVEITRVAEIFVLRSQRYLERKQRYESDKDSQN